MFAIKRRYDHPWDHFAEGFEVCTAFVRKIAHSYNLDYANDEPSHGWALWLY